jgi:hypothetical protein
MADMRDALRKAGLTSEKDVRQAKHRDRVRRKELGQAGLAEERRQRDAEHQAGAAEKRRADRARETDMQAARQEEQHQTRIESLLRGDDLMTREGGPKRFYFAMPDGHIFFLDVSPNLARRLAQGDAAIVDTRGILTTEFAAIAGKTAGELRTLAPERILFWNIRG